MDAHEILLRMPMFAGVSPPDLARLLELAPPATIASEVLLMDVGDPGEDLVIVLSGGFAVELGSGEGTLPLAFVGPGEILGEAALFRGGSLRSARVRAVEEGLVLHLDAAVLDELAREGNGVPRALEEAVMRTMARRVHDSVMAIDGVLASAFEADEPRTAFSRLKEFFRR
jgi:CRP-like cAMP-binding protein